MRKLLFVISSLLAFCLAAPSVTAGGCKKIIANAGASYFYEGCSYGGEDYLWCLDTPITGNLNGTWRFMSRPDWNAFELTVEDVLGIGSWDLWVVWALGVFETQKGDIITQETDLLNLDAYFDYGALSSMSYIIGGTGDYEGATGWLGAVVTETEGGVLRGEICTP
jgi:hypothetical protein